MTAHRATPMTGHEANCLAAADRFVVVRGRSAFGRAREAFPTLAEAKAYAATFGDRRTMIYAVTAEGRSAHIKNA